MKIDYNELSKNYDSVRSPDEEFIDVLIKDAAIGRVSRILDFGCGTGSYADLLQRKTGIKIYGVEPSEGMRGKARARNQELLIKSGDHENIPFTGGFFDLIYMTDVIHHVPDILKMFTELQRVLKNAGSICIMTQSHKQIDERFYAKYFPSTASVDKKRYPDIIEIIQKGIASGFIHTKTDILRDKNTAEITDEFIDLVKKKGYSMFRLIPADEYEKGLFKLIEDRGLKLSHSGTTLIWFKAQ